MNIQVSTSEGSDVGTVQNILGNIEVTLPSFLLPDSKCVGSIADEKNDAFYWFVREPQTTWNQTIAISRDIIFEHKKQAIRHVFVDAKDVSIAVLGLQAPAFGNIVINSQVGFDAINVGDTFQLWQAGVNISGNEFYEVLSKDPALLHINIGDYTNVSWANYQPQAPGDLQIVPSSLGGVLKFPKYIVTGINIIDDMLFWTDGLTEPKKINIPRSFEGTNPNGLEHTKLVVNGENLGPIQESHVTVIKKGPSQAPRLAQLTSSKGVDVNLSATSLAPIVLTGLVDGDLLEFSVSVDSSFEVGDTLVLTPDNGTVLDVDPVRVLVAAVTPISTTILGIAVNTLLLNVEILTIPEDVALYSHQVLLVEYEDAGKNLFKLKFPRFALRYKYEDSEYSPVGPFSNVAFIPGNFDYHPTEAFNLGMDNELRSLAIENYISQDIPKDVTQVDILYKNDTAPSIYIVKSVYKNEAKDTDTGQNAWDENSYKVSTENIYAQLPESQLLRPWDNVPQTALAQDVVGNRVVYGNYHQNYDMLGVGGEVITPSFETFLTAYDNYEDIQVGRKSIKSIRTYDFGIVYIDERGRETPVFADTNAAQTVPKLFSDKSTRFSLSIKDNHPEWADSYKVFIKETSNEYYNLALDRVYDAEDGNVWLSFPSVDRNKVDEETYLILKKSEGADAIAIKDDNRYKIVAIENEAPDYIKTNWELVGEPSILDIRGEILYADNLLGGLPPFVAHSRFTIRKSHWNDPFDTTGTALNMGLVDLEKVWLEKGEDEIYVFFTLNSGNTTNSLGLAPRKSQKYLVNNITVGEYGSNNADECYEISISKPISGEDEWITTYIGQAGGVDLSHPHFYKKVVQNLPEFDGRFFVKIIEDTIIKDKLKTPIELRQNYIVSNSLNAYWFQDTTPDGATSNHGSTTSRSRSDWHKLLKFGGTQKKPGWIIDGAAYAGADRIPVHPNLAALLPESNTGTTHYDPQRKQYAFMDNNLISDFESHQIYYKNVSSIFGSNQIYGPNAGTGGSAPGWGSGYSYASVFSKALHQGSYTATPDHETAGGFVSGNGVNDSLYLSLSYVAPNGGGHQWGDDINKNGTSGYKNFYKNNPVLVNAKKFLQINQKFRVFGADDVYIITEVSERRLFNYRGGVANDYNYQKHGNSSLEYDNQITRFKEKWNRRVNYLIKYELVEDAGDDLSNNSGLDNVSPLVSARIEFIDDYFEEGPNPISQFPAVFETEPKEDVGLDIYYEATNALPLKLTYSNQQNFASVGALLEFTTDLGVEELGDFRVERWGSGAIDPNTLFLDRDLTVNQLNNIMLSPKPHLKFSRPDGSFVFANVAGGYDQYSVVVPATLTSAGFGYDAWRGIKIEILPNEIGLGWHNCWAFGNGVESNRIGDTYNKPYLTNGAKASTTLLEQYAKEHRKNGLIYSGIYNSNSNTNNLNQFIAAEKITKDINPTYGSIQKLHTRDSNLVVLCEDKILKVTANKDALYNADGNPQLIATDRVLGQTIPFVGEYGISQNPESFASESYRAYFTDKSRGAVIRLSMDGITPISEAGMSDWFKDNLRAPHETLIGSYDDKKNEYNITFSNDTIETTGGHGLANIQLNQSELARGEGGGPSSGEGGGERPPFEIKGPITVSYKESVRGWVSFKSFVPENAISCNNEYYTFQDGRLYLHHDEYGQDRNTFYGQNLVPSKLSVVLNDMPGVVKSFNTLNYEGSKARVTQDLGDDQYFNLNASEGWFVDYAFTNKEEGSLNEFIEKEGKWFNYIKGIRGLVSNASDLAGFNVQGIGVSGDGCLDPNAVNYNPEATVDDGTCSYIPFLAAAMVIRPIPNSNGAVTLLVIDRNGDGIHPTNPGSNITSLAPQYYGATYPWPTSITITWVSDGVEDLSLAGGKYGSIYANTPWSITITSGALQIIFSGVGYDTTQETTILQRS
tara:strand:- start:472 stop:6246 length:5775 start_codon:yes stop_codon:yes gene_type:complete